MNYFFFLLFQNTIVILLEIRKYSEVAIFSFAFSLQDEVVSVAETVQKVSGSQIASYSAFSFSYWYNPIWQTESASLV